jgi:AcrR family transcriptional regulator
VANTTKFSEDAIVDAAFSIVRDGGVGELSTRSIAERLGCSTMPVYTYFKSKKNLTEKVIERAYEMLYEYQTTERSGDPYLDMGIGYVLFARDERHLFRCMNDKPYVDILKKHNRRHYGSLIEKLSESWFVQGMSEPEVRKFFKQGWIYSHGLAQLINIDFYPDMDEQEIHDLILYTGQRYIKGAQELK